MDFEQGLVARFEQTHRQSRKVLGTKNAGRVMKVLRITKNPIHSLCHIYVGMK